MTSAGYGRLPADQVTVEAYGRMPYDSADKATADADFGFKKQRFDLWCKWSSDLARLKRGTPLYRVVNLIDQYIDETWAIGPVDSLDGNIYRMQAFQQLGFSYGYLMEQFRGRQFSCGKLKDYLVRGGATLLASTLIFLIQLLGGPFILFGLLLGKGGGTTAENQVWLTLDGPDWDVFSGQFATKLLALLFLVSILLHLLIESCNDANVWRKLTNIFDFFKEPRSERVQLVNTRIYLSLDMFMSCWGCIWSSICAFLLLATAATPQEVIKDGLSILILFNLDDFGSELTFKESFRWTPLKLGWVHAHIVHFFTSEKDTQADEHYVVFEEDEDNTKIIQPFVNQGQHNEIVESDCRGMLCFKITKFIIIFFLFVLPVLFVLAWAGFLTVVPFEKTLLCSKPGELTTGSNQTVCQQWTKQILCPDKKGFVPEGGGCVYS